MADADNVLTVTQLTRRVRGVLESEIGQVWVEGEISNYRLQSSGHHYFTLKDEGAQISCVMFRGAALRMSTRLGDGVQVQVLGELSVYEPRGQYQLVVKLVQPKGMGVLQARFEALKRKLASEGLFDEGLKQALPKFPATIAMVTSPTGAAIRDMLNILSRRAPWVRLLVLPVRVQGNGAEHEIAAAINALNRAEMLGIPKPDVMIVGRGGGSLEDLWNFNEEVVARAIFASRIPVISAVGHEIDFTISLPISALPRPARRRSW
jgi:exodeoxyribonuclease VII large subunit